MPFSHVLSLPEKHLDALILPHDNTSSLSSGTPIYSSDALVYTRCLDQYEVQHLQDCAIILYVLLHIHIHIYIYTPRIPASGPRDEQGSSGYKYSPLTGDCTGVGVAAGI
jgi:hypothetical protein